MANPIIQGWIYSTVLIENHRAQRGTGFLVRRERPDGPPRTYLATNKHVLHTDPAERASADRVTLHMNVLRDPTAAEAEAEAEAEARTDAALDTPVRGRARDGAGDVEREAIPMDLRGPEGAGRWAAHPDADADVLVLDVSSVFAARGDLRHKWMNYDDFPTPDLLDRWQVRMGDEVLLIGYPLGLHHRFSNMPLLRAGLIATDIGTALEDLVTDAAGVERTRVLRGFLVDGGTIPGSSGSPVVLRPTVGRYLHGHPVMDTPPAMLLGILAEARYMPIQFQGGEIPSYSGLGLALDGATVRETIDRLEAGVAGETAPSVDPNAEPDGDATTHTAAPPPARAADERRPG